MVYCGRWYTYGTKSRFLTSPNADMLLTSPVYRILQTCARVMQRNARAAGFTQKTYTTLCVFRPGLELRTALQHSSVGSVLWLAWPWQSRGPQWHTWVLCCVSSWWSPVGSQVSVCGGVVGYILQCFC